MKALFAHITGRVLAIVRSLGPYAAIELLLPGGSLLALLYWWHRHRASQVRILSKYRTRVEVQPFTDSGPARNPPGVLEVAASLTSARSGVGAPNGRCRPSDIPAGSCPPLAA
jgi:hypothetical protein